MPWLLRQAIDRALGEMSETSLEALGMWMIGVIVLLYYANPASSCWMSQRPISMAKPCIRWG
jgi:hypothetical protein